MNRLLAALLLALPGMASAGSSAADTTVLVCGRVFDAGSATMLGPHSIVIRAGRIAELHAGQINPDNSPRVEGENSRHWKYLGEHTCLPGLIDAHVHLSSETNPQAYAEGFRLNPEDHAFRAVGFAQRTLNAGFTTVRDLGGNIALALRNAINSGLVRGPRIIAAGKSLATTGGHADPLNGVSRDILHAFGYPGPEDGVISGPLEARRAVRQRYKEGSDVIKLTATGGVLSFAKSGDNPQFMQDEINAIVATAHDYGYRVAAHAHGKEGMRRAIVAGVDSIEHGTYMDDEIFALMKKHGTWYVPTITAGVFVSEMAQVPGYYPEVVRPKAERIGKLIQGTFGRAQQAGVKIAFGTDAGVFPHGDNGREFALMVEAGMSAATALQSATRNAAELLGLWDELGSLTVGKHADIVAVEGDPLADITLMQRVDFVMKGGSIVKE
jgi:imidazolonepropionase-like amidohydrolase